MIIIRTPLRISFVGGGSDLPAYFEREGFGRVVATTIRKYVYVTLHPRFEGGVMAHYRATETVNTVGELQNDRMREALRFFGVESAEIASLSELPGNTGLGSSSAFTVGLVHALHYFKAELQQGRTSLLYPTTLSDRVRLAREACHIERDLCGASIGLQDQYVVAHGGFNDIRFRPDSNVMVYNLPIPWGLSRTLLLLETPGRHDASAILRTITQDMTTAKRRQIKRMVDYADSFIEAAQGGAYELCGQMLHEMWVIKRELSTLVTSPVIDDLYAEVRRLGAWGGKLCGAGGGGFLLVCAPPAAHDAIIQKTGLRYVKVSFEPLGSTMVV